MDRNAIWDILVCAKPCKAAIGVIDFIQVPWTRERPGAGWPIRSNLDQVCPDFYQKNPVDRLARPRLEETSPFSLISSDTADVAAMQAAGETARILLLSDWTHLTSDEYIALEKETGYDLL